MSYYQQHVFLCANQKEGDRKCCAQGNAKAMTDYLKKRVAELGLKDQGVRVSQSGCMGRCADGPVLVIYPEGVWYTYHCEADIELILQQVMIGKTAIAHLLLGTV